jgi:hypothetical protein
MEILRLPLEARNMCRIADVALPMFGGSSLLQKKAVEQRHGYRLRARLVRLAPSVPSKTGAHLPSVALC